MTDDNGDNGVAVGKTNGQTSANQVIDQGDPEPAHPAHWGFLNSGIVFAAIPIVLFLGTWPTSWALRYSWGSHPATSHFPVKTWQLSFLSSPTLPFGGSSAF